MLSLTEIMKYIQVVVVDYQKKKIEFFWVITILVEVQCKLRKYITPKWTDATTVRKHAIHNKFYYLISYYAQ